MTLFGCSNCIMVLVKKFKWLIGSVGRLPQLIPDQILKLKQLTVLTLADTDKAKDKMEKSMVADNDSSKSIASEVRTKTFRTREGSMSVSRAFTQLKLKASHHWIQGLLHSDEVLMSIVSSILV
ncbi:hypothetical protein RIF29_28910 [Crotalaria pallida]|uniref:Uncharacterized protein n=1 Tax=Crotalaria pallida TaxID=3830 RepID=A0AAN9EEH3_CROPI